MAKSPTGGVKARPYTPKYKRGKGGYRLGGKGHRIGGQGHRLGGKGNRLPSAPRAPDAPRYKSKAETPTSHADRFGPISIAPGTNPDVYLPNKGYSKPAKPGSPSVTFDEKGNPTISGSAYNPATGDDPRNIDPNYWKNFYLIQQSANQNYAATLAAQNSADIGYNTYVDDTKKARENSRKSFARNLIGTGLLRSGYHNMSQNEADLATGSELLRAASEKSVEDSGRRNDLSNILADFSAQEYGLYGDAVDYATQQQMDAAAEGEGIYGGGKKKKGENASGGSNNGQGGNGGGNGRGGGNNNGSGGVAPPSKSLQDYNKIIRNLKKKYAKANTPKAKKRIHAKIKQVRKRKNSKYGR